jgi:CheY-like chemotaxis protein
MIDTDNPPSGSVPRGSGRVVLVVDDDELVATVVAETCRDLGITAEEAHNPLEALEILARHPEVTMLVTDVRMPFMNGPELVRQALALHPGLTVVFITGYAGEESDKLGDWPVLRKPFRLGQLVPALERAARLH